MPSVDQNRVNLTEPCFVAVHTIELKRELGCEVNTALDETGSGFQLVPRSCILLYMIYQLYLSIIILSFFFL